MQENYFKVAFFVLLLVYYLVGIYYRRGSRQREKVAVKHAKREKLLVSFVGISLGLPPFLYLLGWLDFATFQLSEWIRIAGGIFALTGILFFAWVHHTLGKNWSLMLEITKGHTLVTGGPYKFIRHPMYTSIYATGIGLLFLTANWLLGICYLLPFTILYVVRVNSEEELMIERFGEEYREYMKRTGRLLPKF